MKPSLIIGSLALAASTLTNPAAALLINQNAVGAFNPYYGSDHPYISYYYSSGVSNTHTSLSKYVAGGLVRNDASSQTVWIFSYFSSSTASLTCYIYGRNYDGTLQDSDTISFAAGSTGYRWLSASLSSITSYANISALCYLPPNSAARVFAYAVTP